MPDPELLPLLHHLHPHEELRKKVSRYAGKCLKCTDSEQHMRPCRCTFIKWSSLLNPDVEHAGAEYI